MRIKDTPKIDKSKTITRQCVICGGDIFVAVSPGGKYSGGNFFGTIEQAKSYNPTGETINIRNGHKAHISKPVGKIKKWEYWECDGCYNEKE